MAAAALSVAACGSTRHTFSGGVGLAGADGAQGEPGPQGPAGADGLNGIDGLDGVGTITIGDSTLVGDGSGGPLGISVLSPELATGDIATVGAASGGQLVTVGTGDGSTAQTASGQPDQLLGVNLGGQTLLGQNGTPLIGLGVLSPNGASGTAVTGNVLSGGQPVGVGVGGAGVGQGGTTPAPSNPLGGLLGGLLRRN